MKNRIILFLLFSLYGCATHLPLNKKRILQSNTHIGQPFDVKIDTLVEYRMKKGHVKKERFSLDGNGIFNWYDSKGVLLKIVHHTDGKKVKTVKIKSKK